MGRRDQLAFLNNTLITELEITAGTNLPAKNCTFTGISKMLGGGGGGNDLHLYKKITYQSVFPYSQHCNYKKKKTFPGEGMKPLKEEYDRLVSEVTRKTRRYCRFNNTSRGHLKR